MQEFLNDERGYADWLERHPNGFVLTVNARSTGHHRIHRVDCMHLYDPDPEVRRTRKKKLVADNSDELLTWARSTGAQTIECSTCKPYSS